MSNPDRPSRGLQPSRPSGLTRIEQHPGRFPSVSAAAVSLVTRGSERSVIYLPPRHFASWQFAIDFRQ